MIATITSACPCHAVSAKRTMLAVRHMNIARHVRTRPQRMASAFEDPRAEVDKEQAIGSERQGERRPFSEHD